MLKCLAGLDEYARHMSQIFFPKRRQLVYAGLAAIGGAGMVRLAHAADPDPLFQKRFPDPAGAEQAMSGFLGKPVVVNFWATWCPPCIHEMPDLQALSESHPHAAFVGLAVDTAVNVRAFAKDKVQVSYPLLIAGHEGIELMRPLGNSKGGLPFTVVFDAQGQLVERILGLVKPDSLDATLAGLKA